MKIILLSFLAVTALNSFAAPEFLVQPVGQATGDTCQSYALAVGLAFQRDSSFRLETSADLRNAELSIRAAIKQAAGGSSVNHEHIRSAFQSYTGGRYKLEFKDVDLSEVGKEVGARSGVSSAAATPPSFLLGSVVKAVTFASATRIERNSYADGHIFAILGADGPPNSNQRFLVLNSAVKVKNTTQLACQSGVPDDPGPYTAELSWKKTSEIDFKPGSGKVRLWVIEQK